MRTVGVAIGSAVLGLVVGLTGPAGASTVTTPGERHVAVKPAAKVVKTTATVKVVKSGQVVKVPAGTRQVKVKIRPAAGVVITSTGRRSKLDPKTGCLFLTYPEAYGFAGDPGDGEFFCPR